jgi:hypothetical protein
VLKKTHIPYILACHPQSDAGPDSFPAYHFDAYLDPDPTFQFDADPNPDPQHWVLGMIPDT